METLLSERILKEIKELRLEVRNLQTQVTNLQSAFNTYTSVAKHESLSSLPENLQKNLQIQETNLPSTSKASTGISDQESFSFPQENLQKDLQLQETNLPSTSKASTGISDQESSSFPQENLQKDLQLQETNLPSTSKASAGVSYQESSSFPPENVLPAEEVEGASKWDFSVLNFEEEEPENRPRTPPSPSEEQRSEAKASSGVKKKKLSKKERGKNVLLRRSKILILTDDKAKGLSFRLHRVFGFRNEVIPILRPGCVLEGVIRGVKKLVEDLNLSKNDFLVVLAGSQDVYARRWFNPLPSLELLNSLTKVTNVIISEIPMRFNLPENLQGEIREMNNKINTCLDNLQSGIHVISVKEMEPFEMHTDGFSYTRVGTNNLAYEICNIIYLTGCIDLP